VGGAAQPAGRRDPRLEADPDQTTRLRWQRYDYWVTSNHLGFPGPADLPVSGDLRILALGDAFTSAEG